MAEEPIQPAREERVQYRPFTSGEEIERAVNKLKNYTTRLRLWGAAIVVISLTTLAALAIYALTSFVFKQSSAAPETFSAIATGGVALSFIGLLYVFLWEKQVKLGMILYEEISDELE